MGRLFGTNGVREIVGEGLTAELALKLGMSLGSWLSKGSTVAFGMDARTSSPMLGEAVAGGLMATGANVVRLGVCPSPAIQFYVKGRKAVKAGVIITASHNPPEFNGIKFIADDGTEMSAKEEDAIEEIFFGEKFRKAAWNLVGSVSDDGAANDEYVRAILARVDREAIRRRKFKVVVDTAGGAGGVTSPRLLRELGCEVTSLFEELDGTFSGRPSEPKEKNLAKLIAMVRKNKADLGIAHDGDADRCALVDERGMYVPGDKLMALLSREAVKAAGGGTVTTPISTSSLVEEVVKQAGGALVTTAVGSPIVARAMMRNHSIFGGEENGGMLFPELQLCRDGGMTAAKSLELLARANRPLSALVEELPRYHVVKTSFACPAPERQGLTEKIRSHYKGKDGLKLDTTDGIKVYHPDGGWVLMRPSGTEPIYRVFAESKDPKRAEALAEEAVKLGASLLRKKA